MYAALMRCRILAVSGGETEATAAQKRKRFQATESQQGSPPACTVLSDASRVAVRFAFPLPDRRF
jgi:hypothetical protein